MSCSAWTFFKPVGASWWWTFFVHFRKILDAKNNKNDAKLSFRTFECCVADSQNYISIFNHKKSKTIILFCLDFLITTLWLSQFCNLKFIFTPANLTLISTLKGIITTAWFFEWALRNDFEKISLKEYCKSFYLGRENLTWFHYYTMKLPIFINKIYWIKLSNFSVPPNVIKEREKEKYDTLFCLEIFRKYAIVIKSYFFRFKSRVSNNNVWTYRSPWLIL